MNPATRDPLDTLFAELPRDVPPERDLWPDIRAQLQPQAAPVNAPLLSQRWFQLAAAVVLVVTSSVITYIVVQSSMQKNLVAARQQVAQQLQPVLPAMPVRFDGHEGLGKGYEETRAELDAEYAKRVQSLPPVTRAKVERDIADVRRAARDISATLAEYPSDPLLQDLLVSTYQRELQLMSDVNAMAASSAAGTDL